MTCIQDKARIMENVCKMVPSLRDAKVVQDWVGLRPYREPVRLELSYHEVLCATHAMLRLLCETLLLLMLMQLVRT